MFDCRFKPFQDYSAFLHNRKPRRFRNHNPVSNPSRDYSAFLHPSSIRPSPVPTNVSNPSRIILLSYSRDLCGFGGQSLRFKPFRDYSAFLQTPRRNARGTKEGFKTLPGIILHFYFSSRLQNPANEETFSNPSRVFCISTYVSGN